MHVEQGERRADRCELSRSQIARKLHKDDEGAQDTKPTPEKNGDDEAKVQTEDDLGHNSDEREKEGVGAEPG